MEILLRICIVALSLMGVARLVPGISVNNIYAAFLAAIVLGILNAIARPILILLTLPITIVTFGLFVFCINALIFWIVSTIIPWFTVHGFLPALFGSLFVSIISTIAYRLLT